MTGEETEVLRHLMFAARAGEPQFDLASFEVGDRALALHIMAQRLALAEPAARISEPVVLFCTYLCDRPGRVVTWAWTLVQRYRALAPTRGANFLYGMRELIADFPNGFPTAAQYAQVWDAQKGQGAPFGNLLDVPATWRAAAAVEG